MPDWIISIVGLIILIAVSWQISRAMGFMNKKANQKVFARRGHREGQELVSQRLEFHARGTLDEVRNAILATVKAAPGAPAVIADAHLIRATDTLILYGYGNKLRPHSFRGALRLEAVEGGVQGSWEIVNWTLADGIVAGQSVMRRLIADINTALRTVDPKAALRVSMDGAQG